MTFQKQTSMWALPWPHICARWIWPTPSMACTFCQWKFRSKLWVHMGEWAKLPGSWFLTGLLIQQHEWVSNTIFSWRMFSENFRQVLLSSIELELNLNSNPCEGLSYYDTFCFAEILSSKIIFSEMNDYFNNLPYFFAAISFPLFLHNHCLAAQLK